MQESPLDSLNAKATEALIVEVLKTIYDPELPVSIYDLGLIYSVNVDADGVAVIEMTLTTPACPVAETLPPEVKQKVESLDGVTEARVDLVWEPPWTPDRMSDAAKLDAGLF